MHTNQAETFQICRPVRSSHLDSHSCLETGANLAIKTNYFVYCNHMQSSDITYFHRLTYIMGKKEKALKPGLVNRPSAFNLIP